MNSIQTSINFLQEKWYLVLIIIGMSLWNFVSRETDKEIQSRKCEYCLSVINLKALTCKNCGKDQKNQNPNGISEEKLERIASYNASYKTKDIWGFGKNKVTYVVIFIVLIALLVLFSID